jgi:hypothetical protein
MRVGGRVLLTVLKLYVRIKIRVATFNNNHSVACLGFLELKQVAKLGGRLLCIKSLSVVCWYDD